MVAETQGCFTTCLQFPHGMRLHQDHSFAESRGLESRITSGTATASGALVGSAIPEAV